MRRLLDTHLLLWAASDSPRLPRAVADWLDDPAARPVVSTASLWEVTIKAALGRADFRVDPARLRGGLLAAGYEELAVEGPHVLALGVLPPLHSDPFDRMLVAQARAEGLTLWTSDAALGAYGDPVERIAPRAG